MRKSFALLSALASLLFFAAPATAATRDDGAEQFDRELRELAARLDIPGLAYVIVEDGQPIVSRGFGSRRDDGLPFTTDTPLRIASVTKALTAVAAMRLVEEGKLDLDAAAKSYEASVGLPAEVSVRHLLTHTSEGRPGELFVYGTTRFSKLGPVLAAADGQSFEQGIRGRIIEPAGMRWHPSEGLGAHAALVSTVDDMARFVAALDQGKLIRSEALRRLETPSISTDGSRLPVSLGWFAQDVQGVPVMWSFGQDDPEHSGALLLRIPERKLTLFLLANSNLVSDPFRLLAGDVRKSPFAMSFLRNFVFAQDGALLPPLPSSSPDLAAWLDAAESGASYSYADELVGDALIDAWRGERPSAEAKLELGLSRYTLPPDPVVHFIAMQFDLERLRPAAMASGEQLLADQPRNRWLRLAQGYLLQRSGDREGAAEQFEAVLGLPNQEEDFLHLLFKNWSWLALAELHKGDDPDRAKSYLREAIGSGVQGPTLESAKAALAALEQ